MLSFGIIDSFEQVAGLACLISAHSLSNAFQSYFSQLHREDISFHLNLFVHCGRKEIRTLGAFQHGGFQDHWYKPLTHPSENLAEHSLLSKEKHINMGILKKEHNHH